VAASFAVPYFARELTFRFFGWPFSFFVAAQGAPIAFLVIVGVYAFLQARRDGDDA
jgi:putative solute:sodium symporter small subunit